MIAGPQITSSFFLATSNEPVKNSPGYLAGAALSITTVATVAYVIALGATGGDDGGGSHGTTETVIDWIILGLLGTGRVEPQGLSSCGPRSRQRGSLRST